MNKKLFSFLYLGIFIGIVGLFFYPTIFRGKLPVPSDALVGLYHPWRDLYAKEYPRGIPFKNFLITDPVRQQIPWRKIAIAQWKEGKIPKWNPYTVSGTPLVANIQAAVFYPLNILFFIFDFPVAWTILIILEPLLAGVLLFLYLRHLDLDPLACLLGAVAWSFSGFFIAWLTWGTMIHVALWLPLMLLSIDCLLQERKKIIWFVVFVLSMILQMFAGHVQIVFYSIGISLVYGIWRFLLNRDAAIKTLPWFISGVFIFVTLSSVQWLPFLRFLFESGRIGEVDGWLKAGWFLPWQHMVQFLVPDFFGNPATLNYWGVWNYGEFIGYIGVVPLLFVALCLFGKRNKDTVFWIGVALVALLFTLPTPLAKLPYQLRLPILFSLQPTRLMVVIDFSLVMLAVFGFDGWLRNKDIRWSPLLVAGALFATLWIIVLLKGGENFQISKRNLMLPTGLFIIGLLTIFLPSILKKINGTHLLGAVLIGITAFDLLRFGWKFTPFTPSEYFFPKTAVIEFLQKQEKPFRVMSMDNRVFPPNVSAYYAIETIEGYDPLISQRYEELMAAISRGRPDITPPFGFNRIITFQSIDSPLLPMFNIRFVLTLSDVARPFLKKVFQEGETRVYEYTRELPRAFFVDNVRWVDTKQEALNILFDNAFNLQEAAVVEKWTRTGGAVYPTGSVRGKVTVVSYSDNKLVIETETNDQGFLVVSQSYSPDWKAVIFSRDIALDPMSTVILKADYDLMGIFVPKGKKRVEFFL